jgi:hypothetical protein
MAILRCIRGLLSQRRDPWLEADYVEELQPGPKRGRSFSPGRYLSLPGVERDAVPWPPKQGIGRAARSYTTGTRHRG